MSGHIEDRWARADRKGRGARWRARYTDPSGRERSKTFERKTDAQRFLATVTADALRGVYVDPTVQTTVSELVRAHAATRMHRASTARRVDSVIRNHVEATPLGARRLAAVRPSEAQAWVSDRSTVLAPLTLRYLVQMMRSAYAAAVLDRLVTVNPFARVTLPRVERERIVPLTVDQVTALADQLSDQYRALVVVQAGLGLRIGEALALRVRDVDFLRRTVRVEDQIDRHTRERVAPKTARSRRTLPLPDVVAEELARHIAVYPPADGLLFHTRAGRAIGREQYAGRAFIAAAKRAGLPEGTTTHDLRHHFASLLLASGQSVIAVAELLGHENATLVLTTYGHLMPGGDDLARRAIDAAWRAVETVPVQVPTAQGRPG